jgi:tripartite-type tricarboxylate transporter receptor subunit TctC
VIAAPGLSAEQKKFWDETMAKMVATETWKKAMKNLEWDEFYQNSAEHTKFLEGMNAEMQENLKTVGLIK